MIHDTLMAGLAVTAVVTGVLMFAGDFMARSKRFAPYRIRHSEKQLLSTKAMAMNIAFNMGFSLAIYVFALLFLADQLYQEKSIGLLITLVHVIAVLLVYDFGYYLLHRGLHHPKAMILVHGVHHKARFPSAMQSMLLSPWENLAGIGLLLLTIMLLGPMSVEGFVIVVFIHSVVNVLNHVNLVFPHPMFRLTNYLALKHDYHHDKHLNRNFASMFSFWDKLFGTYR